ncbi:Late embryogenesis abundant protein, LEA-14 [Cucumis melo var. makuwa]|uniref:Late embryogenesis abundant protein, LEA-14 n=1 Tax=Cucumis melo var. makuwa TaxID=1194695 RepID=A0A5D3CN58_CUCMM|nr:Late embryogenesis abundant protein, LEA-14 [Cucumis melo var. makuwa]
MSVVLAKTDSEVSSLTPSSPTRSPSSRRPVYYVQSPSRDSHDGEKTTNSFHSSPVLSPMGSPPHSHSNSSLGPHSRDSSSTRFSASVKPGSRKPANHKIPKPWKRFDAIEEERLLDDDGSSDGFTRRCYFLAFVISFVLLFSLFSLILWGASRPQKPTILMKSILFDKFVIQAGADFSGVATGLVTMNATVKFIFRNTATFFGVQVTSTPLQLSYSQLTLASGTVCKFFNLKLYSISNEFKSPRISKLLFTSVHEQDKYICCFVPQS